MSALQFVFAAIGLAIALSVSSLLWPKVTSKPMPDALVQVKHAVEQTPIGKQTADVLGVSDDQTPEPINIGDWAVAQGNAIISNITESATDAVVSSVAKQIGKNEELQQILCATESGTKQ